jgi:hypothetical protein
VIREFAEGKAVVTIISTGRANNVQRMQQLIGEQVVWITKEEDRKDYLEAGATNIITGGGLCESRNRGLDLGRDRGVTTIQLSDDLSGIDLALSKKEKRAISFDEAVNMMLKAINTGFKLVGTAPTNNPFFTNTDSPLKTAHFIVGDFIAVSGESDLRFDYRMKLKEDYDYTLQHLHEYGAVGRVDLLLPRFAHRTNSGGAVAFRNAEREQEAIAYLKDKWVDEIRDNPRRENEILLKWCGFLHAARL